jgi:DNA-binding NtrC family response regulator
MATNRVRAVVVVEDDEDVQDLIAAEFSLDSRFTVAGVSASAEDAFEMALTNEEAVLIVLDQGLAGRLTGLQAAPAFKDVAPLAKVILFTAHEELREAAAAEPAVDAFVLKTDSTDLLRVAQQMWA